VTIGTGTFLPSAKFYTPRSYIYQLDIALYGDTITHVAGRFTIHAVPPDPTIAVIQFDSSWYLWNSNKRSLDHIVTEFWYKAGGIGPEIPLPFTLGYWVNTTTRVPGLFFNWSSGPRLERIFDLPAQPLNYWLPPPLS
jgi:hypothetical protein